MLVVANFRNDSIVMESVRTEQEITFKRHSPKVGGQGRVARSRSGFSLGRNWNNPGNRATIVIKSIMG